MATASLRQQKLERQAFPPLQLTPRLQNSQGQHSTTQATDKQSRRKTLITTGSPSTCMVFTWQRGLTAAILREACGKRGLDCRVLKQWPTLTVPRGHGKKCLPSWKTRFPKLFIEYLGKKKKYLEKDTPELPVKGNVSVTVCKGRWSGVALWSTLFWLAPMESYFPHRLSLIIHGSCTTIFGPQVGTKGRR